MPSLRAAATGAAEAGQPERDLTEQGGDLVGAVILDLARGSAGATQRPSDRMVAALNCDDFPLDQSDKPLALRQGQAQSRNVAQIIGAVDYEPPQDCRRLQFLRDWSHDEEGIDEIRT